jgi:SPP1 gp7 family putative phage head morphogenesis protein
MGRVCCDVHKVEGADFVDATPAEVRYGARFSREFRRSAQALVDAWETLDPATAEDAYRALLRLPWQEQFSEPLRTTWEEATKEVMTEAGERSFRDLKGRIASPSSTLLAASFSVENPYSRVYIRERSSRLIVQITEETREAVKEMLDLAIRNGVPPKQLAPRIGNTVGLHKRWARAVDNRLGGLLMGGMPYEEAKKEAAKYANKLRRRRGENIARTEIVNASNQGTLDSWSIAQDNAWIPPTSKKEWIAGFGSARTCKFCAALHGTIVGVNELFPDSGLGQTRRPPLHPSCRCTIGLVFDKV